MLFLRLLLGTVGGVMLTAFGFGVAQAFGWKPVLPGGVTLTWPVVIAGGVVFGLVSELLKLWKEARQQQANRTYAELRGWTYTPRVKLEELGWGRGCSLLRRDSVRVEHLFQGTDQERPFTTVDLSFSVTSGSGKNRSTTTYVQTVYRFEGIGAELGSLRLMPRRGYFRWIQGLMNATEVALEPPPNLPEEQVLAIARFGELFQFSVDSDALMTGQAARAFHPLAIAWLTLHPHWSLESDGRALFAWRESRVDHGDRHGPALEELDELLRLFAAGDQATARLGTVELTRKEPMYDRDFAAMVGYVFGGMIGLFGGFVVAVSVILIVEPQLPRGPAQMPIIAGIFFGGIALGVFSGLRLGRHIAPQDLIPRRVKQALARKRAELLAEQAGESGNASTEPPHDE